MRDAAGEYAYAFQPLALSQPLPLGNVSCDLEPAGCRSIASQYPTGPNVNLFVVPAMVYQFARPLAFRQQGAVNILEWNWKFRMQQLMHVAAERLFLAPAVH